MSEFLLEIMRIVNELWEFDDLKKAIEYFCEKIVSLNGCNAVIVSDSSGEYYRMKKNVFSCKFLGYTPKKFKIVRRKECGECAVNSALIIYPYGSGTVYIYAKDEDDTLIYGLSFAAHQLSQLVSSLCLQNTLQNIVERLEMNLEHFQFLSDRLRNPLAVIVGVTELKDELPENKIFNMICESAEKISRVLEELNNSEVSTINLKERIFNENCQRRVERVEILKGRNEVSSRGHEIKRMGNKGVDSQLNELKPQRIYSFISRIPNSKSTLRLEELPKNLGGRILVTKWLEYLMGKVGNRLEEVLDYYVSIGWISRKVKGELLDYAYGMFVRKIENGEMKTRDHAVSMMFIEMLKRELKKG